jgi:hypothetical protein
MNDVRATDLPAFQQWSKSFLPGRRASAYLEHHISAFSAMLVLELVFPRLIEVRGCVLRADKYEQANFDAWWAHLDGDREQLERITNFFPTKAHFPPADSAEEEALKVLAEGIARGWQAQSAAQFPDRPIAVEIVDESEDDGPTVIMYTIMDTRKGAHDKANDGLPTPRVQEFERQTHRETGDVFVDLAQVRPATPQELADLV